MVIRLPLRLPESHMLYCRMEWSFTCVMTIVSGTFSYFDTYWEFLLKCNLKIILNHSGYCTEDVFQNLSMKMYVNIYRMKLVTCELNILLKTDCSYTSHDGPMLGPNINGNQSLPFAKSALSFQSHPQRWAQPETKIPALEHLLCPAQTSKVKGIYMFNGVLWKINRSRKKNVKFIWTWRMLS